jgi:hypothetical protein
VSASSQYALGDFCQTTYQLVCLFVRLRRCGNRCIVRLCASRHALKTNENPAQSGMLFSANRLKGLFATPTIPIVGGKVKLPQDSSAMNRRALRPLSDLSDQHSLTGSEQHTDIFQGLIPPRSTASKPDRLRFDYSNELGSTDWRFVCYRPRSKLDAR